MVGVIFLLFITEFMVLTKLGVTLESVLTFRVISSSERARDIHKRYVWQHILLRLLFSVLFVRIFHRGLLLPRGIRKALCVTKVMNWGRY